MHPDPGDWKPVAAVGPANAGSETPARPRADSGRPSMDVAVCLPIPAWTSRLVDQLTGGSGPKDPSTSRRMSQIVQTPAARPLSAALQYRLRERLDRVLSHMSSCVSFVVPEEVLRQGERRRPSLAVQRVRADSPPMLRGHLVSTGCFSGIAKHEPRVPAQHSLSILARRLARACRAQPATGGDA